jgi:hypothetical protein
MLELMEKRYNENPVVAFIDGLGSVHQLIVTISILVVKLELRVNTA